MLDDINKRRSPPSCEPPSWRTTCRQLINASAPSRKLCTCSWTGTCYDAKWACLCRCSRRVHNDPQTGPWTGIFAYDRFTYFLLAQAIHECWRTGNTYCSIGSTTSVQLIIFRRRSANLAQRSCQALNDLDERESLPPAAIYCACVTTQILERTASWSNVIC